MTSGQHNGGQQIRRFNTIHNSQPVPAPPTNRLQHQLPSIPYPHTDKLPCHLQHFHFCELLQTKRHAGYYRKIPACSPQLISMRQEHLRRCQRIGLQRCAKESCFFTRCIVEQQLSVLLYPQEVNVDRQVRKPQPLFQQEQQAARAQPQTACFRRNSRWQYSCIQ